MYIENDVPSPTICCSNYLEVDVEAISIFSLKNIFNIAISNKSAIKIKTLGLL